MCTQESVYLPFRASTAQNCNTCTVNLINVCLSALSFKSSVTQSHRNQPQFGWFDSVIALLHVTGYNV